MINQVHLIVNKVQKLKDQNVIYIKDYNSRPKKDQVGT